MTIPKEIPDELLKGVNRPENVLGDAGLMKELKARLMDRMPGAELTAHLGLRGPRRATQPKQSAQRDLDQGSEGPGRGIAGGGSARPSCSATPSRYMQVEAFARIDSEETDPILSMTSQAA